MNVTKKFLALCSTLLVASAVGCTSDHTMQEVTETSISAATGGTAKSHDGVVELFFPPNALSADTTIRIETQRDGLTNPRLVGAVYDFSPNGLTFQVDAEVRIRASEGAEDQVVANFDTGSPVVVDGSTHDREANLVRAPLQHFSSYGSIIAYDPCPRGTMCGTTCTVCDPAIPTCVEPPGAKVCNPNLQCVVAIPSPAVICNGPIDAGQIDAGPYDAGRPDATVRDAGTRDGGPPSGVIQEVEPNNSIAQAQQLPTGIGVTTTVQGAITPAGDEDYYRVDVPGGLLANLHAITYTQLNDPSVCVGADTVLTLFDSSGVSIAENDDNGTPCSEIVQALQGGTYYLRVRHFNTQSGTIANYFLDITLGQPRPDGGVPDAGGVRDAGGGFLDAGGAVDAGGPTDGGSTLTVINEVEPNDTPALAQFVPTAPGRGLTISGSITPAGDRDLFSFTVPPGAMATLNTYTYTQLGNPSVCVNADTFLTLFDGTMNVLTTNDDANGTSCSEITRALSPGSYFVEVRHFNTTTGLIPQYYLDLVWR